MNRRTAGKCRLHAAILLAAAAGVPTAVLAGDAGTAASHSDTAQELQNPFTNLIVVPFQNITAAGFDPGSGVQNVLNIQPAVPVALGEDWKLILRPILPLVLNTWPEDSSGIGDLQFEPFFSPVETGSLAWGFGPVLSFPTASHEDLGTGKFSAGPAIAVFGKAGKWTYSVIATQEWSFAGDGNRPRVSLLDLQPTVNYNFADGWFLMSGPLISADWTAESGQSWIVPLGGGFGRVFSIGGHHVSLSLEHYWNVEHPDAGPDTLTILTLTLVHQE